MDKVERKLKTNVHGIDNLSKGSYQALSRQDQPSGANDRIIKLNIDSIKRNMVIPILIIVFHEFRDRFPKSLRLYTLACYTKNVIMRKPFLCSSIMRRFDDHHLSKFDLITRQVNDLYLLSKLGFIPSSNQLSLYEQEEP